MACTAPIPIFRSINKLPLQPFSPPQSLPPTTDSLLFDMSPFDHPPSAALTPPKKIELPTPAASCASSPISIPIIKPRPVHKINGFTPEPCFSTPDRLPLTPATSTSTTSSVRGFPSSRSSPQRLRSARGPASASRSSKPLLKSSRAHSRDRLHRGHGHSHGTQPDSDLDSDLDNDENVLDFDQVLAYRLERRRITAKNSRKSLKESGPSSKF
ncbi:hypothetical protein VKT23_003912 [Stygiomarasmius scandens]|uniref:Uncharacterized protein n=1 Tax=Marasmiellus scandens TaxID=2682957 RepID=A0ABR1JZD0_9AGAR